MTGRIDVYIPRRADGELMTGWCGKRSTNPRSLDVRTFFDPLADRNLPNAIPAPKAKAMPKFAPKGWRLRPVEPEPIVPTVEVAPAEVPFACRHCGRHDFRTPNGLAWHVERCTVAA